MSPKLCRMVQCERLQGPSGLDPRFCARLEGPSAVSRTPLHLQAGVSRRAQCQHDLRFFTAPYHRFYRRCRQIGVQDQGVLLLLLLLLHFRALRGLWRSLREKTKRLIQSSIFRSINDEKSPWKGIEEK